MTAETCVIFDKNYLEKALALFESLDNRETYCNMHILCLDDDVEIFFKQNSLNYSKIKITTYSLREIEKNFKELRDFKEEKKETNLETPFNKVFINYCWALTPFFCYYLIHHKNLDHVLYCDSDLYFYDDILIALNEAKDCSIGIITHKHPYHLTGETSAGIYNVGIVYFKNDKNGRECTKFWKDLLLNPANEFSTKYGTCGDQKYLELFPTMFKGVKVLDDFAYGAPWCFHAYEYVSSRNVIYMGRRQILLFNHFSHFNIRNNEWFHSWNNEWGGSIHEMCDFVKDDYRQYFESIMRIRSRFNL